jgi:predicted dehydrogenase
MIPEIYGHIKLGFLGGAINSAVGSAHYAAIRLINQLEVVAGCFSRHSDLNEKTAVQYGIDTERVYGSLDDLIVAEKGKIDALVILTPTDQHAEQVLKCIKAGIPVICEKALACSSEEALVIQKEVRAKNGFLAVIYNYLGYPMLRELRRYISTNELGKIIHIQIEMPQEGFNRIGADGKAVVPQNWRLHDGHIPTISLDLGVHLHMMVRYLTGETPLQVVATSDSLGNFREVKDNVSGMIQYSNDIICNLWYSKIALGNRNGLTLRLYGEKGSAEWIQEEPEYLHLANRSGKRWTVDRGSLEVTVSNESRYTRFKAGHPAGFIEAFANYYYDIAASLENYKNKKENFMNDNCFGVEEAFEGLSLLEAIARSGETRSWEFINAD